MDIITRSKNIIATTFSCEIKVLSSNIQDTKRLTMQAREMRLKRFT
jgi:hypothetical protein